MTKMFSIAGSRLTNFVGILSQGLRIAPPEAPATGYMVLSITPLSYLSFYVYIFMHVIHNYLYSGTKI